MNRPVAALITRLIAAGVSFAFGVAAARMLGVERFGVASVLLSMVNVGVVIALLGHETLATRQVATLDNQTIAAYRSSAALQTWLAGVLTTALALITLVFLPIGKTAGYEFLFLLVLVPLIARTRLSQGLIRGAHRASLSLFPDGIARPSLAILLMLTLGYLGQGDSYSFVLAMVLSSVLALAYGMALENRVLTQLQLGARITNPIINDTSSRFSGAIYASSLLAVLVSQLALIVTGTISSPTDAGLFAAAERLAFAAGLIGQAIYLASSAKFAELYARNDFVGLRGLVRRTTSWVSIATVILCFSISIAPEQILEIYGSNFSAASAVLIILLLAVSINALTGPTGVLLLMTNNEKDHLRSISAGLIALIASFALLVPVYGAAGAAISVLASTIVSNIFLVAYVHKRLRISWLLMCA